jgi:hypothetical protein
MGAVGLADALQCDDPLSRALGLGEAEGKVRESLGKAWGKLRESVGKGKLREGKA